MAFLLKAVQGRSGSCEWEKSSPQTCCFRVFPALFGWDGGHFHPTTCRGSPSLPEWELAKGGEGKEAEKAGKAQTLQRGRLRGGQLPAALTGTRCSSPGSVEGIQGSREMQREGFIPAACASCEKIYWKCHPRLPGQTHVSFLRAAQGVINCYCRESTQCFSFNSKDVFNLPVALCKL